MLKSKRKEYLITYSLSSNGPSFIAPRSSGRLCHLKHHQIVTHLFHTGSFPIHICCMFVTTFAGRTEAEHSVSPHFSLCKFHTDDEAGYWCKIPALKGFCEWI